jgi:GMP synthase (glutamine-hydrolysing)
MSHKAVSILKMGFAEPEIRPKHGDYVDMVRQKLPAEMQSAARVIEPAVALPEPKSVDALVITGSSSMVTDPSPDDLSAFRWLERIVAAGVPVLGICYGHQMLGHVLGGKVGPLPGGPEIGVADVKVDAEGDPLFSPVDRCQKVAVIHWQTVLELPRGARVLGRGTRDPHHIVRFGPKAWGVQFHPEFGPRLMTDYANACANDLRKHGEDPQKVATEAAQWPGDQTDVVARFAREFSR